MPALTERVANAIGRSEDQPRPDASLGLLPADGFRVVPAPSSWPGVPRQPLWYFRGQTIALPVPGAPVAGFTRGVTAFDDVRTWASGVGESPPQDLPPLVWVAAPDVLHGARLVEQGNAIAVDERRIALDLVARHPLNRSWLDRSSFAFLGERSLKLRGTSLGDRMLARTIWPEDFVLGEPPPMRDWPSGDPAIGIRSLMREEARGGARAPFAAHTLWRRPGSCPRWAGKAVLAFIVNGAQGDDDEAHAGHFAIVTGRVRDDGAIGDWLVHNFYSLDIESEKGILAAPVPLDNYLADLNAGQAWYRPSHILVGVLDDERAAQLVDSALARVYQQFYRHQLVYYHPRINCTSISVDTLAALGWQVGRRGASAPWLARLGLPWLIARERGLAEGLRASDYLSTEVTRLLPAAAFEEIAAQLHALAAGNVMGGGQLARWLVTDLAAIALLRIPQFPSSRSAGDAPVVSLAEYRSRLPAHRRDCKIVPVPARPFPDDLRDDDLLPPPATPAGNALKGWLATLSAAAAAAGWAVLR